MKTYCISDIHLGDEHSNVPKVIEFFQILTQDKEAGELFILGDFFDTWLMEYEEIINTDPYQQVYNLLLKIATKIPVYYIAGNHDSSIVDKLKVKNIFISDCYTRDNIFYTHGHQYDEEQVLAHSFYRLIIAIFPKLYQRFFKTPAQLVNNKAVYEDRVKGYHNIIRREIKKYNYDFMVVGHSHNPLIDGKLVDCGDFVTNCTFVIFEDKKPKLVDL